MGPEEPYKDEAHALEEERVVRGLFDATAPPPDALQLERMAARAVDATSNTSGLRWSWLGGAIAMAAGAMALFMVSPTPQTSVSPPSQPIAVAHEGADANSNVRQGAATPERANVPPDNRPDPDIWDDMSFLGDEDEDVIGGLGLLSGPSSIEDVETDKERWDRVLHAATNPHRPI